MREADWRSTLRSDEKVFKRLHYIAQAAINATQSGIRSTREHFIPK
jgi:hypothetical protein